MHVRGTHSDGACAPPLTRLFACLLARLCPRPAPQLTSSGLDTAFRDDLERLKKIRNHRGLRHYWGLRVKGQHTKTTGRAGKTIASESGMQGGVGGCTAACVPARARWRVAWKSVLHGAAQHGGQVSVVMPQTV